VCLSTMILLYVHIIVSARFQSHSPLSVYALTSLSLSCEEFGCEHIAFSVNCSVCKNSEFLRACINHNVIDMFTVNSS